MPAAQLRLGDDLRVIAHGQLRAPERHRRVEHAARVQQVVHDPLRALAAVDAAHIRRQDFFFHGKRLSFLPLSLSRSEMSFICFAPKSKGERTAGAPPQKSGLFARFQQVLLEFLALFDRRHARRDGHGGQIEQQRPVDPVDALDELALVPHAPGELEVVVVPGAPDVRRGLEQVHLQKRRARDDAVGGNGQERGRALVFQQKLRHGRQNVHGQVDLCERTDRRS